MNPPLPRESVPALAQRLRSARQMRRMKQRDITAATGLAPSAVSEIERGNRLPSAGNIVRICRALHISADHLLGLD